MIELLKVFVPGVTAFALGILAAPLLTHYLYKHRVWKKKGGKEALDGKEAVEFNKLHGEREKHTPRMGGILIWGSVLLALALVEIVTHAVPSTIPYGIDFLSRGQTWMPFFALLTGAAIGFINDLRDISVSGARGIPLRYRLLAVGALSLFIGWWFYDKLDVSALALPWGGELTLGILIIPAFMLVSLALYASGVIDGIDGLSGGVFASIYAAYAIIAFEQAQYDLAAFCAAVVGGILAFLWFNIPPARFWMTETGTMALTLTLAVVAFMTDTLGGGVGVSVLPIIGFLLVATVLSNLIQIFSKKFRGKKVFRIAPLHHHFEALGWPGYKVTMRYWVLSVMFAILGLTVAILAAS